MDACSLFAFLHKACWRWKRSGSKGTVRFTKELPDSWPAPTQTPNQTHAVLGLSVLILGVLMGELCPLGSEPYRLSHLGNECPASAVQPMPLPRAVAASSYRCLCCQLCVLPGFPPITSSNLAGTSPPPAGLQYAQLSRV